MTGTAMTPLTFGLVLTLAVLQAPSQAAQAPAADEPRSQLERAVETAPAASEVEAGSAHLQATFVDQYHGRFKSPYAGTNSLSSGASARETADLTAFLGLRLWRGGELYVNPEVDQGFGLSDTVGVAGFPSGEAYKVGRSSPYLRLNRLFVRQVFALPDSETEQIDSAANAIAGPHPIDNVTITVGKFSVTDIFDANTYAHDPRADFFNWSIIDAGAFDYAADAWGYTYGAAIELSRGRWSVRGGVFSLSDVPNSQILDRSFRQYSLIGEVEERHTLAGRPGRLKLLGFVNRGRMARYEDAVRSAGAGVPDVANVRRVASRPGASINAEQELASNLGAFLRASANDGRKEAFEFTEINRSIAAGLSLKGGGWDRPHDNLGVAGVVNGLSGAARKYFAAGGLGILIGDGALAHYGSEQILEIYYSAALIEHLHASLDLQHIVHPAYNRDRGPVSIVGVRLHAEF
jgi:high affinity Mn2+ porin